MRMPFTLNLHVMPNFGNSNFYNSKWQKDGTVIGERKLAIINSSEDDRRQKEKRGAGRGEKGNGREERRVEERREEKSSA